MKKPILLKHLFLFISILIGITIIKQFTLQYLIQQDITEYKTTLLIKTSYNILLTLIAFYFIKIHHFTKEAGLSKVKPKKVFLLVFGAFYLIALNFLFSDLPTDYSFLNITTLLIYCLSIGYAEELSIRGFLQTGLSKHFKNPKKAIFIASLIFGLLHLLNPNKGLYGEIS